MVSRTPLAVLPIELGRKSTSWQLKLSPPTAVTAQAGVSSAFSFTEFSAVTFTFVLGPGAM